MICCELVDNDDESNFYYFFQLDFIYFGMICVGETCPVIATTDRSYFLKTRLV